MLQLKERFKGAAALYIDLLDPDLNQTRTACGDAPCWNSSRHHVCLRWKASQHGNPKFYFFDTGVQRALNNTLTVELKPQTYAFGVAFEHFVINEINRLQSYAKKDYRLFYLRTKDDVEIDLLIERPGLKRALVEIKSTERVTEEDVRALQALGKDIARSEAFCLSLDQTEKKLAPFGVFRDNAGWKRWACEVRQ